MIAIVHSIYSQSVHALALNAGLMDNDAGTVASPITRSPVAQSFVESSSCWENFAVHFFFMTFYLIVLH